MYYTVICLKIGKVLYVLSIFTEEYLICSCSMFTIVVNVAHNGDLFFDCIYVNIFFNSMQSQIHQTV